MHSPDPDPAGAPRAFQMFFQQSRRAGLVALFNRFKDAKVFRSLLCPQFRIAGNHAVFNNLS